MPVKAKKPTIGSTVKKNAYLLKGGPLDMQKVYLRTPGTLEFTLHGQKGYYDHSNQWVSTLK